ncbi:hypothetical protein [Tenggerimyces flavus]|uniref:Uncharacterized protein n=1 Tax=Tenggerimyces flavus TaxID=1708749 RepID=A0ABV7YB78_9ACTN|nr:hypothetical protein [Tenggerimyces flavus]MBM7786529.1 UPF0716 family protein affecting phage T7 exclusion [Tenggerimyces flavus]
MGSTVATIFLGPVAVIVIFLAIEMGTALLAWTSRQALLQTRSEPRHGHEPRRALTTPPAATSDRARRIHRTGGRP